MPIDNNLLNQRSLQFIDISAIMFMFRVFTRYCRQTTTKLFASVSSGPKCMSYEIPGYSLKVLKKI